MIEKQTNKKKKMRQRVMENKTGQGKIVRRQISCAKQEQEVGKEFCGGKGEENSRRGREERIRDKMDEKKEGR